MAKFYKVDLLIINIIALGVALYMRAVHYSNKNLGRNEGELICSLYQLYTCHQIMVFFKMLCFAFFILPLLLL